VLQPHLQAPIDSITFLKLNLEPDTVEEKQSIVVLLCTDSTGRQYVVEMQVGRAVLFEKRLQYYAGKAYCSQIQNAQAYLLLKETIVIAIVDSILFPHIPSYKSRHVYRDDETGQPSLTEVVYYFLELPKSRRTDHNH
jgi:predicted transposase/invertase (TIGR01784 family)